MKIHIIFALCIVHVNCAAWLEKTIVTEKEQADGYSCKSNNDKIGLMKEGEVRVLYDPTVCAQASCRNGLVSHISCGVITKPPVCELVSDLSKPYPDCCPQITC